MTMPPPPPPGMHPPNFMSNEDTSISDEPKYVQPTGPPHPYPRPHHHHRGPHGPPMFSVSIIINYTT